MNIFDLFLFDFFIFLIVVIYNKEHYAAALLLDLLIQV